MIQHIVIDNEISLQLSSIDDVPTPGNESVGLMPKHGVNNPYKMA